MGKKNIWEEIFKKIYKRKNVDERKENACYALSISCTLFMV